MRLWEVEQHIHTFFKVSMQRIFFRDFRVLGGCIEKIENMLSILASLSSSHFRSFIFFLISFFISILRLFLPIHICTSISFKLSFFILSSDFSVFIEINVCFTANNEHNQLLTITTSMLTYYKISIKDVCVL